jgi:hypothetical protein
MTDRNAGQTTDNIHTGMDAYDVSEKLVEERLETRLHHGQPRFGKRIISPRRYVHRFE